jgi:hypothetical protein
MGPLEALAAAAAVTVTDAAGVVQELVAAQAATLRSGPR